MARIISDRILEEIKSRTSIVDVVSSRITLKRAGGVFKACCPFHREKTPSFTVNPARESFKCFGCGEGGDIFSFVMKHDGMTFADAVKTLAERCGVDVVVDDDGGEASVSKRLLAIHTEISEFYRRCLLKMKGAEVARAYLASRDLPSEIGESFKIGYAPDHLGILESFAQKNKYTLDELVQAGLGTQLDRPRQGVNLHDRFRGRLIFPICDTQGRVVAFSGRVLDSARSPAKYVNSPETAIFKKSRILYALDKAQRRIVAAPHREAIICEGQIDVIRCHACGFDRAVASQGTAFTEEHAKLLKRYADSAVLVFDQDPAGQKAAVRTGAVLLAEGIPVRVARLDLGEDPDSFLRKHPSSDFQQVLDEAIGLVPFHIAYLRTQESDPESEGAVGRIAADVLQTVAQCRNEVHKARMLQEAASLLRIPEVALERELSGMEEVFRRQRGPIERREAARISTAPLAAQEHTPLDEPLTYLEPDDSFADLHVSGSGATSAGRPAKLPDRIDLSICELLVHSADDRPEVVRLLIGCLPDWIVADDLCRRIVAAYYDDSISGGESVLELQQKDSAVGAFLGSLAILPNRAGTRESCTEMDLAQELALSAWRRWCVNRREALAPIAGQDDSPETARKRFDLLLAEKKLVRWETGATVIQTLMGSAVETPPPVKSNKIPLPDGIVSPENPPESASDEWTKAESRAANEDRDTDTDEPPLDDWIPEFEEDPEFG